MSVIQVEQVKDMLALAYVNDAKNVKQKELVAKIAFRLLTGLAPFPSQIKQIMPQLEARGDRINEEIHRRIEASIGGEDAVGTSGDSTQKAGGSELQGP